mmetsp:Transcript_126778/g.248492  ORF Transcript_126778/g.248492 Transcript_126778/m.248492 type:complete len:144 (-) Transcript_126778:360-791(-)
MVRIFSPTLLLGLFAVPSAEGRPGSSRRLVAEFVGCYDDIADGSRDLPRFAGAGSTLDCAHLCRGYAYFGRQSFNECWCGDSYGKFGRTTTCKCDGAADFGAGTNCVYKNHVAAASSVKAPASGVPTSLSGDATKSVGPEMFV